MQTKEDCCSDFRGIWFGQMTVFFVQLPKTKGITQKLYLIYSVFTILWLWVGNRALLCDMVRTLRGIQAVNLAE